MAKRSASGLPSPEQLLAFIRDASTPVGKREIAQAFGLRGADKIALKAMLKDLEQEGTLAKGQGRSFHQAGGLPKVGVVVVTNISTDGDVFGRLEGWTGEGDAPSLRIMERRPDARSSKRRDAALGLGDRVLARLEERAPGRYRALPMKRLERKIEAILGVLRPDQDNFRLEPTDKRARQSYSVSLADADGASAGELVRAEPFGRFRARVVARLGNPLAPKSFSLIAIAQHRIPDVFADAALAEAKQAAAQPLGAREDLRDIPLITIDPADARDHDDAVWAAPDGEGWRAIVAIADVSFYVRPGGALDAAARERGNSTYFPDRVVPMLPEVLSADVCSLKPGVERACLACHLRFSATGEMIESRFSRAVMRSAANLAYEKAQAIVDGQHEDGALKAILEPLWGAWRALKAARDAREPLALDLPERRIQLDAMGKVIGVSLRSHLDAHQVIEDFMIAANVAAARALEKAQRPVAYRVHEPPSREKLVALKDMLETVGQAFALGQSLRPAAFNHIISRIKGSDVEPLVQEMVLRTQTQAYYTLKALGHFGLSLNSYAHFTSPIRRYADVLVHRALVGAFKLGEGGLDDADAALLDAACEHVSNTERRSMAAERDTVDRYVASYLANRTGEEFDGRVTGVTRFGLFVTLAEIGGDGLIPISTLGDERFEFDDKAVTLTGQWSGTSYRLGQTLKVRLVEAAPISGGLRFELVEGDKPSRPPARPQRSGRRGAGPGKW